MNHYTLQITSKALDDMEGIYNYIAVQLMAPEAAIEQYNRIADAIEKLNVFPERIKIMESEPEHTMGFRRLTIDNYSIFYVVKGLFSNSCKGFVQRFRYLQSFIKPIICFCKPRRRLLK